MNDVLKFPEKTRQQNRIAWRVARWWSQRVRRRWTWTWGMHWFILTRSSWRSMGLGVDFEWMGKGEYCINFQFFTIELYVERGE